MTNNGPNASARTTTAYRTPGGSEWLYSGGAWRCLDGTDAEALDWRDGEDNAACLERCGYKREPEWTWRALPLQAARDRKPIEGAEYVEVYREREPGAARYPFYVEVCLEPYGDEYGYGVVCPTFPDLLSLLALLAPIVAEAHRQGLYDYHVERGHREEFAGCQACHGVAA